MGGGVHAALFKAIRLLVLGGEKGRDSAQSGAKGRCGLGWCEQEKVCER